MRTYAIRTCIFLRKVPFLCHFLRKVEKFVYIYYFIYYIQYQYLTINTSPYNQHNRPIPTQGTLLLMRQQQKGAEKTDGRCTDIFNRIDIVLENLLRNEGSTAAKVRKFLDIRKKNLHKSKKSSTFAAKLGKYAAG